MEKKFGILLTRDQMKKINGGASPDDCPTRQCYTGYPRYACYFTSGPSGKNCYCFDLYGVGNTGLFCPPNGS